MADQVQVFQHLHSHALQHQHKQDSRPQQQQQQLDHVAPQVQIPAAQQPGQQLVHLNWSYFKPEFSGKPDKNTEAHLLHTNDWMNAHHFIDGIKVQRFCLTLLGEARLWYQSLKTINADWGWFTKFV